MKKFLLKLSIVFLFLFLLFRFTIISLLNEYEQKLENFTTSSNLNMIKDEMFNSMNESNNKERILDDKEALILSIFIKKILNELDLNR